MKLKQSYTASRAVTVAPESLDLEARTIEMSFSSEFPVQRYDWELGDFEEVLDHSPEAVDLSRFTPEAAAPFLMDHDTRRQVGVVVSAQLEGEQLRGTVRISRSPEGEQFLNDVADGIRRNASISYRVTAVELHEKQGELPRVVVRAWAPWEVSSVAAGADPTVGVGRNQPQGESPYRELLSQARSRSMDEPTPTPSPTPPEPRVDVSGAREEARKAEQARCRELIAIGQRFDLDAQAAIADGTGVDEFRARALDALEKRSKERKPAVDLPTAERSRFNIGAVVRALMNDGKGADLEREVTQAYVDKGVQLRDARSFFVPWEMLGSRAVAKGGSGGNLVGTTHLDSEYVPHLLSDLVLVKAGARLLPGLVGDADIPAGSSGFGTATHAGSETADAGEITPAFRQIALTPKTGSAFVDFSRRMRLQSQPALDAIARQGLTDSIMELVERTGIQSTGSATVPQGIIGTSNVGDGSFGAAFAYKSFIDMWATIKGAKGTSRRLGYVTSFACAAKAMTTTRGGTGSDRMIAEMMADGQIRIDGLPLYPTQENPSDADGSPSTAFDSVVFGDFSQLLIASWGDGVEVSLDYAALAKSGGLRVLAFFDYDLAVLLPQAFAAATDVDLTA